jgi:NADPH2:quinone reductase
VKVSIVGPLHAMVLAPSVIVTAPGGPEALALVDREVGDPGPEQVRIAVAAAGVNRADVLQRRGLYPAPPGVPADVLGLEFAGTVEAVGDEVDPSWIGRRAMGIVAGGGQAGALLTRADALLPVPDNLEWEQAAALPEAFLTSFDALVSQGRLAPEEVVLIHAVGSGIGTAALQLAGASNALAIGTSRTADKLRRCEEEHGLPVGLAVTDGTFADAVLEATDGHGADVILDTVGAAYLEQNLAALAPGGRLVVLGLLGGATGTLPLGTLLAKRARIVGSVLRSRSDEDKAALTAAVAERLGPLFNDGWLVPVVDEVFAAADVAAAHARLESDDTFGKLVLRFDD